VKVVEVKDIVASASAAALLAEDEGAPHLDIGGHPVWREAVAGRLGTAKLRALVRHFYPVIGGAGRYAFAAKIGTLDRADGVALFQQLYAATHEPAADADAGWSEVAKALGVGAKALADELADPLPEAQDLIDIVRLHGEQSTPAEAAAVAWVIERRLPRLWGEFAAALQKHYGVPKKAVGYLRHEAGRAAPTEEWTKHLVDKYLLTAAPYTVFEARRAMREVGWGWTALTEAAVA
jgi:pyrroloquinoline quinone (PQQ) biosynthesis protein C